MRKDIAVRTDHCDKVGPRELEGDTVAHGGESMARGFCWNVLVTNVHTQWKGTRAIWNKGQHKVRHWIEEFEKELAFPILSFDSDYGGEFLNWHLRDYFWEPVNPC